MRLSSLKIFAARGFLCCILSITCTCGVLIFGDSTANNFIGKITRGVQTIVNQLWKCSVAILGERITNGILRIINWIIHERNPLLQIVYVVIILPSFTLWIGYIWPYWDMFASNNALNDGHNNKTGHSLTSWHIYASVPVMLSCITSWIMCCLSDPGAITTNNHSMYYSMFRFGPIFSYNNVVCRTCKFMKCARSKHCSLCNVCIAKFDHHCPWINSCVGIGNYHHFLNFLFMHWFMCAYGTYLNAYICYYIVFIDQDLFSKQFVNRVTKQQFRASYKLVFQWMMSYHQLVMSLTIIGFIMGFVLFLFWFYHVVFLAMKSSTTNENHKYSQLKSFMTWREKQIAKEKEKKQSESNNNDEQKEKRYLFKDFNMKNWSNVNIYDKGIFANLYDVYFPFADVDANIKNNKKKMDDSDGDKDNENKIKQNKRKPTNKVNKKNVRKRRGNTKK